MGCGASFGLQQLGRGDRELERRFDALMLKCTKVEAGDANHARHRGVCVGRRQRVGAAPGRLRRESRFGPPALCPHRRGISPALWCRDCGWIPPLCGQQSKPGEQRRNRSVARSRRHLMRARPNRCQAPPRAIFVPFHQFEPGECSQNDINGGAPPRRPLQPPTPSATTGLRSVPIPSIVIST
jgi:hypothetical protein